MAGGLSPAAGGLGRWRCARGACLFCRLLTLPSVCFLAPIPPTPFPAGRGSPKVYFAGGFAPGAPALDRLRRLQYQSSRYFGGGLVSGGGGAGALAVRKGGLPFLSPADPAFSVLSCPYPPDPLPGGKGEPQSLFCRGLRPRRPCIRPLAALTVPVKQVLRWGACPRRSPRTKKNPEPNDRADSEPQHYLSWIEVLGGLGDSFKSPPAFLPFPSLPVTASMGCQAGGRRGLRRSRRRWRRRGR